MYSVISISVAIICAVQLSAAVGFPKRLTVEIEDNDFLCLHEELKEHKSYIMLFEVILGGQFDIDLTIKDPNDKEIYRSERHMHDTHHFNATMSGIYTFCLNNEFSSISHKRVYFELTPDDYESLSEDGFQPHVGPLTAVENDLETVHLYLSRSGSLQMELKNRELTDRLVAEELSSAIFWWSTAVACAILIIGIGQILTVKNFFSDRKTYIPRSMLASRR